MLDNAFEIKRVVLATGRVDLRKGVLGLATIIGADYDKNPYEKGTLEDGRFSWPRDSKEAAEITEEQFNLLMLGINPLKPKVKEVYPTAVI